jgi:hypothetical protein
MWKVVWVIMSVDMMIHRTCRQQATVRRHLGLQQSLILSPPCKILGTLKSDTMCEHYYRFCLLNATSALYHWATPLVLLKIFNMLNQRTSMLFMVLYGKYHLTKTLSPIFRPDSGEWGAQALLYGAPINLSDSSLLSPPPHPNPTPAEHILSYMLSGFILPFAPQNHCYSCLKAAPQVTWLKNLAPRHPIQFFIGTWIISL